jgi:hypothetical protein
MLGLTARRSANAVAPLWVVFGAALVIIAVGVVVMPWPISFGIAVACAIAWCLWLEHNPHMAPPQVRSNEPCDTALSGSIGAPNDVPRIAS